MTAPKTTDRTRLNATALRDAYKTQVRTPFTVTWTDGQSISGQRTSAGFELRYSIKRTPHSESVSRVDRVDVEARPCPLGGERLYLICPSCRKPRAALYGSAPFACRVCHGLVYPSQMESGLYPQYDRGQEIANQIAGRYVKLGEPFPERPKGMHRRTYEAKREKWDRLTRPAREYFAPQGFGDLADHSDVAEAGRIWRISMAHRAEKLERKAARKAERARKWKAAYFADKSA